MQKKKGKKQNKKRVSQIKILMFVNDPAWRSGCDGTGQNEEFDLAHDFLNRAIPEDCPWVTEDG